MVRDVLNLAGLMLPEKDDLSVNAQPAPDFRFVDIVLFIINWEKKNSNINLLQSYTPGRSPPVREKLYLMH